MDNLQLWQRYQDWLYYHPNLELYLDVSRIPFDEAFLKGLEAKFARAFQDMAALE
ncbi:MAG: glucose-6-phosphate isomerase, partial [Microcystis sp.]